MQDSSSNGKKSNSQNRNLRRWNFEESRESFTRTAVRKGTARAVLNSWNKFSPAMSDYSSVIINRAAPLN